MKSFMKVDILVIVMISILIFCIWLYQPNIKLVNSGTNTVSTTTNTAVWSSGSGVQVKVQVLDKELDWCKEIKDLLSDYTIIALEFELMPKVETLFIDIPANTNARVFADGETMEPLNKEICERYFSGDDKVKEYLQSVFEETMSNNAPFTMESTYKKGILLFPKCQKVKSFEFNVFNSEADIGKCKINFEEKEDVSGNVKTENAY